MSLASQILLLATRIGTELKTLKSTMTSSTVMTPFVTADSSEKVASLPIAVSGATKYVVFSVEIPDLAIGDHVVAQADFQVTNDYTYNALCSHQLILSDTATGTTGTEISEASGTNVTPGNHHMQFTRAGALTVAATTRRFVNLVAYSQASQAAAGDLLTVDADYGRLSVQRYRTVANTNAATVVSTKADLSAVGDINTDYVALFEASLV
jgi:hypothetical protein